MRYVAADFGAGSGRIMAGNLRDGILELEEIHRFNNRQIRAGSSLYWDFLALLQELKTGISIATKQYQDIAGIGIDTWGVDFGLIDKKGNLVGNPYCYRDERTRGILEKAYKKISREEIYRHCGIQSMEINTAFQLLSMQLNDHPHLQIAHRLLFMPDLFNYFLTGSMKNEYTIASTSSLLDASGKKWSEKVIRALELPGELFCDIVHPGEKIGTLSKEVCEELQCYPIDVFAVGSHDTASAAAITSGGKHTTAFLSSGTWSLFGVHLDQPVLDKNAMSSDITNEGGIGNKITFLKNITGLWMLQCALREWETGSGSVDYNDLLAEAAAARPFSALVNPDHRGFANPPNMCNAISEYCRQSGQEPPESRGQFARAIMESLALKYREAVKQIEASTGNPIEQIHIVGGGSQNEMLNQFTSDATGLPVIAGPVEATAIGNIVIQAMATGEIPDVDTAKDIIWRSFHVKSYQPGNSAEWADKILPE